MNPQTKLGKVVKESEGCDVRIKCVRVLYLLLPSLVDNFHNEVFARRVRRFVEGMVISLGFVFPFCLMEFCSRYIPVNCVIV